MNRRLVGASAVIPTAALAAVGMVFAPGPTALRMAGAVVAGLAELWAAAAVLTAPRERMAGFAVNPFDGIDVDPDDPDAKICRRIDAHPAHRHYTRWSHRYPVQTPAGTVWVTSHGGSSTACRGVRPHPTGTPR